MFQVHRLLSLKLQWPRLRRLHRRPPVRWFQPSLRRLCQLHSLSLRRSLRLVQLCRRIFTPQACSLRPSSRLEWHLRRWLLPGGWSFYNPGMESVSFACRRFVPFPIYLSPQIPLEASVLVQFGAARGWRDLGRRRCRPPISRETRNKLNSSLHTVKKNIILMKSRSHFQEFRRLHPTPAPNPTFVPPALVSALLTVS